MKIQEFIKAIFGRESEDGFCGRLPSVGGMRLENSKGNQVAFYKWTTSEDGFNLEERGASNGGIISDVSLVVGNGDLFKRFPAMGSFLHMIVGRGDKIVMPGRFTL